MQSFLSVREWPHLTSIIGHDSNELFKNLRYLENLVQRDL